MASDLLMRLLGMNLAAAVAIVVVLVLRKPARTTIGAQGAYALWLIVPVVMLACLLPPRTVVISAPPSPIFATTPATAPVSTASVAQTPKPVPEAAPASGPTAAIASGLEISEALVGVWLAGVVISLILLAVGQHRAIAQFGGIVPDPHDPRLAHATNPRVGPALLGTIRPRVILPADFEAKFDAQEQAMILAHERTHLAKGHAIVNAFAALARAVHWFNPFVHIAARCARVDQELSCDAAVMERFPGERQAYAQALLKTQLAFATLSFGCDWPVRSAGRLEERIRMLAQDKPGRLRMRIGVGIVAVLTAGAGLAAWAAEPPVAKLVPVALPMQAAAGANSHSARTKILEAAPAVSADANQAETPQGARPAEVEAQAQPSVSGVSGPAIVEQPPQTVDLKEASPQVQVPAGALALSEPRLIELAEARVPIGDSSAPALRVDADRSGDRPALETVAASVGAGNLDRYEGYYQLLRWVVFHVYSRNNQLHADTVFSGPDVKLVPGAGMTFIASSFPFLDHQTPARITFTVNANGNVTGLILRQDGRDWFAPMIEKQRAWKSIRASSHSPSPGTQAILEHFLQSVESGAPDYSAMSPSLAAFERRSDLSQQIRLLGPVKAVHFRRVSAIGSDVFTAVFQHTRMNFEMQPLDARGQVPDLLMMPTPPPDDGASCLVCSSNGRVIGAPGPYDHPANAISR